MKIYVLSLLTGIMIGAIYSLLGVRSPAPPVIALIGLFGILLGEQAIPLFKQIVTPAQAATTTLHQCGEHLFGLLPGRGYGATKPPGVENRHDRA